MNLCFSDHEPTQEAAASGTPPPVFEFVLAEPGHTPIPEIGREIRGPGPTLLPTARPAEALQARRAPNPNEARETGPLNIPKLRTNLNAEGRVAVSSKRPEDPAVEHETVQIRRKVSFRLPTDTPPSPNDEITSQDDGGGENSSSNKENKPPPFRSASNLMMSRLSMKTMSDPESTSLHRVPSLGQYTGVACKSTPCSPDISPEVPKEFKVRGSRLRKTSNDALQSLKLAAEKDDMINQGSPQGVLPTLRRIVSGFTGLA